MHTLFSADSDFGSRLCSKATETFSRDRGEDPGGERLAQRLLCVWGGRGGTHYRLPAALQQEQLQRFDTKPQKHFHDNNVTVWSSGILWHFIMVQMRRRWRPGCQNSPPSSLPSVRRRLFFCWRQRKRTWGTTKKLSWERSTKPLYGGTTSRGEFSQLSYQTYERN